MAFFKKLKKKLKDCNRERKAQANAIKKSGSEIGLVRIRYARYLRRARQTDRVGGWGVCFNTSLKTAPEFFGERVEVLIKNHMSGKKDYHILSLGTGSGIIASELESIFGKKAKISATGVAKIPQWKKHQNSKQIDWHITTTEKLLRTFGENSLDFIEANLSINKSRFPGKTWSQINKVLKPGGRILFTSEKQIKVPSEFRVLYTKETHPKIGNNPNHPRYGSRTTTHAYYLEKK